MNTKTNWVVLLVSALTDAVIAGAGIFLGVSQSGGVLNRNALIVAGVTGAVAGCRTIQQALRAAPETLNGSAVSSQPVAQ